MTIDQQLKNARMKAGLTQEHTAEQIKVSRQTISNWERGKSLPDVISLIMLSDLYQMSLDDLLKGDCKIIDKIVKDTNTVKSNQTMMNFGWFMLMFSFVFSIWHNYDGTNTVLQFIRAGAQWVLLGLSIALILASHSNKKKEA